MLLGVEEDLHTSPCDPEGEWYDATMVAEATERYYRRYRKAADDRNRVVFERQRREGLAILNRHAQERNFADWDAYQEAGGTYTEVIASFGSLPIMPGSEPRHQENAA